MIQLEIRHCILCGPDAPKRVKYHASFKEEDLNAITFSARRSPDRCHFQLVECMDCGMIYSDPVCDPSLLATLYDQSCVNYALQESQIYLSYLPVLDRALMMTRGRNTFLEIGGGSGFMLRYGVENGFSTQIEVEPSLDAEKKFTPFSPETKFIRRIFKKDLLPPCSVSLVCFFQMLDHVPNPLEFLNNVFTVLEPGGVAVCVTHNTQAWSARILGERSPIFDIEHTYLFNPENMFKLFKNVGFQQVQTFNLANYYAIHYWLNLSPVPSPVKKVLLPVLKTAQLANVKLKIKAGNFALIALKPAESLGL